MLHKIFSVILGAVLVVAATNASAAVFVRFDGFPPGGQNAFDGSAANNPNQENNNYADGLSALVTRTLTDLDNGNSVVYTLTPTGGTFGSSGNSLGVGGNALLDGSELIVIEFSAPVSILGLTWQGVSGGEFVNVTPEGGSTFTVGLAGGGFTPDFSMGNSFGNSFRNTNNLTPIEIGAGETLTIAAGNGTVGLAGINADVIPEPASLALLGLGGLMMLGRILRQNS